MKNKKLYAAAITAALVVSAFGSTVMAADPTGTTNFTYQPGTAGPTDPIDPTDPENDENNWIVSYPRQITLMDNNEAGNGDDAVTAKAVGKGLNFSIRQQIAGEDGDQVTQANIGNGIEIKATGTVDGSWTTGNEITMKTAENNEVTMQLITAGASGNTYIDKDGILDTFTAATGNVNDNTTGYAVLKYGTVDKAVEGASYSTGVIFTFAKKA